MAGRSQHEGLVEQPIGWPIVVETCTGCGKPTHPTESNDNGECASCSRVCETCNGSGTDPDLDEVYEGNCLECNGEGTILREATP